MQSITTHEALMIMDAMRFMFCQDVVTFTEKTPDMDTIEQKVCDAFVLYCEVNDIVRIIEEEDEDEELDIPDDVDETNYDPYMGCDSYDDCDIDEGW